MKYSEGLDPKFYDDQLKQFLKDYAAGKFPDNDDNQEAEANPAPVQTKQLKIQTLQHVLRAQEREFLRELSSRRYQKGWTQADLAQATGISQSNIANLESGLHSPSLKTLLKITHSLGLKLYLK